MLNTLKKNERMGNTTNPNDAIKDLKKQVANYVSNAKTDKAFEVLEGWTNQYGDNDAQAAFGVLKNEWKTLNREQHLGFARNADEKSASIYYRLLNLHENTHIFPDSLNSSSQFHKGYFLNLFSILHYCSSTLGLLDQMYIAFQSFSTTIESLKYQ